MFKLKGGFVFFSCNVIAKQFACCTKTERTIENSSSLPPGEGSETGKFSENKVSYTIADGFVPRIFSQNSTFSELKSVLKCLDKGPLYLVLSWECMVHTKAM